MDFFHEILKTVEAHKTVLVGIGREWRESVPEQQRRDGYETLTRLLRWANFFIVTMNTDDLIFESGLDPKHIVAPFGSDHRYQCQDACTKELWLEKDLPEEMICPYCGSPLVKNRKDAAAYVEEGYLDQWQAYTEWLSHTLNQEMTILELGVGFDMPSVIRWPFERIGIINQKAHMLRVHQEWYQLSEELSETGRALSVPVNSCTLFAENMKRG